MKLNEHLRLVEIERQFEAQAREWINSHLAEGETIESLEVSIKVKTRNPLVYVRPGGGGHAYLSRQLTEDELAEITSIEWPDVQNDIVKYCIDPSNLPCESLDQLAIHILPDQWNDQQESAFHFDQVMRTWNRRSALRSYIRQECAKINNRLRHKELPYRLVLIPLEDVECGGYRFYKSCSE